MEREKLVNLNIWAQMIAYICILNVSQLNARGICALLQCSCEAVSLFRTAPSEHLSPSSLLNQILLVFVMLHPPDDFQRLFTWSGRIKVCSENGSGFFFLLRLMEDIQPIIYITALAQALGDLS